MEQKTITVGDVIKAINENGFDYYKGQYFHYIHGKHGLIIDGGCAIGQAAINLNVDPWGLYHELNRLSAGTALGHEVTKINDNPRLTNFSTVQKRIRKLLKPYADKEFTVPVINRYDNIQRKEK